LTGQALRTNGKPQLHFDRRLLLQFAKLLLQACFLGFKLRK